MDGGYDYDQQSEARLLRQAALVVVCGVIAIFAIIWFIRFLTTGKVIVTSTAKNSTVAIFSTAGNPVSKQNKGKLSVHLHPGTYVASVTGSSLGTSQVITVKARHTLRYTIRPAQTSGIEPVLDDTATAVAANNSRLFFVDGTGALNKIDSGNNVTQVGQSVSFQSVKWADSGFGVGETSSGGLYTITNGVIAPLTLTMSNDAKAFPVFAVDASHRIYVALGKTVYSGNASGSFRKIYTAPENATTMAAAGGHVAIITFVDADDGGAGQNSVVPSLSLVSDSGKAVKRLGVAAFSLAFSPSGNYLALGTHSGGEVFDDNLNVVKTLPQSNFLNPVWLNNVTLFYSVSSQLWSYSIGQQRSQILANAPLGQPITELDLNDDASYLYIGVANSDSGAQNITRIGLKGQKVNDALYQLQDILPTQFGSYGVSLVNFTEPPTVVAQYGPNSSAADAVQAVSNELKSRAFDLSKLRVTAARSTTE